jgi:hypothetical protein
MGITLPNFAQLGFDDPRNTGGLPQFRPEDPVAEGEAALGTGIQKAGIAASDADLYQTLARDKLNESMATVNLFNGITPLEAQIKKETDPARVAELRAQAQKMLESSANAIDNPLRKQMWMATHARTIAGLQTTADTQNTILGRNQAKADIFAQRDAAVRNAVGSDDPMALPNAQMAIETLGQYGSGYGALEPTEKYAFTKGAQNQLYEGRADRLIQQGRGSEATAFLEANRDKIDPVALERLQIRATNAGSAQLGAQIFQRAGGVESGDKTSSAAGSSAIGSAIFGTEGSGPNAVSYKGASGRAQIIESTFNENKQAGESYANESDRVNVANRLIDQYTKTYNGDPARVAVAYFSGPGNVAPEGSPTPWISDKTDGISTTSGYVRNVLTRLGQAKLAQGAGSSSQAPGELSAASLANAEPVAIGDSITAHLIRKAGVAGQESGKVGVFNPGDTAVSGFGPTDVLGVISSTPVQNIQGRNVVLSTGVSNNPGQIDQVVSQIQTLKSRGAASVTVLGVGTADKLKGANDQLAQIATQNGATFAGPLAKVASDGIHSSDPKAVLQQAQAAMPAAPPAGGGLPSADQQIPAPGQLGATPAAPAAQPPGLPAPGVSDIAAAQQIADQQYAQKLERIGADPAAVANPVAFDHATKLAENEYRRKTLVLTGQMKALTEARNAASSDYVREALKPGGAPPDLIDRMLADKRLDGPTLENLSRLVEQHAKHTAAGDLVTYGPKFYEAYGRLTLDESDPAKIRDPSQVYAMAQPKPDGTQDLSMAGVAKLTQSIDELKKRDPALAERKKEFLQLVMPMDRNDQAALTQRYNMSWDIDQHIAQKYAAKQNPNDLFNPSSPDWLGKPYQDQIAARQMAEKIQGKPEMKTKEGIAALYQAKEITRDQAAQALTRLGIKFLDQQPAPAGPVAPIAIP